MTHKILDHETQKIIYRSALRPKKSFTPNHRLAPHGGEVSASSDPSTFDPSDLIVEHSSYHLRRMGRGIEPRLPDKLLKLLIRTMAKG